MKKKREGDDYRLKRRCERDLACVCVCVCVLEKRWIGCWEERREEQGGVFFWQGLARTERVVVEKKRKRKKKSPRYVDRFFLPSFSSNRILAQNPKSSRSTIEVFFSKKNPPIIIFPIHIEVRGGIIYDEQA